MKSIEQAYLERYGYFKVLHDEVRAALDAFCFDRNHLLSSRIKTEISLRDKVETGRFGDLDEIDDTVAFSVVIDSLDHERGVRDFVKSAFHVVTLRSGGTIRDERVFDFDCTRVYCKIRDPGNLRPEVSSLMFEVQIRTLLQHAWSRVTHGHVYKPSVFDYRASRFAAELMAHIENLDRAFANFVEASKSVRRITRRGMSGRLGIVRAIDNLVREGTIPPEMRPPNGRRLGDNIYESIDNPDENLEPATDAILSLFREQAGRFPRSVSLYQLAVVALHRAMLLSIGAGERQRYYYVTDELTTLFPDAATIPNRIRIT